MKKENKGHYFSFGTRCRRQASILALLIAALAATEATAAESAPENLADLSLEELGNIQVTSVSKHSERLLDAPASIYVISAEDIRRSGVTSLPEALRLAPNLQVVRTNASQYAISSRGFNNAGNKLLVLIDGRTVYTPLYSGVIWYDQDVMLEDVERIEVISGPGGTLWGSNAVNGVINVITRAAQDTQGGLVSAGLGNRERGAAARYGGELDGSGHFRIYAKGFDDANTNRQNGTAVSDGWERAQTGFRADWGHPGDGFTLQGDAYRGRLDLAVPTDEQISGANLLGRWTHRLAGGNQFQVQAYFDQTELEIPGSGTIGTFSERLNIADIEFQHSITAFSSHAITWGGGYRSAHDHLVNVTTLAFLPAVKDMEWANLFVQDEIALRDNLSFTAGAKAEKNPYTGVEFLPSIRLAWKLTQQQLLWSALSRAVRTPSRLDRDLYAPPHPPYFIAGGPDFRSEVSKVLEIGYRAQPTPSLSYSLTAFHHIYDYLRSVEATGTNFIVGNQMEGKSTGLEAWSTWQVTKTWRLSAGAFYLDQDLRMKPNSTDPTGTSAAGNDPTHQFTLRSSLDLPHRTELDIDVRNVGRLPNPVVPSYTAVDMRIGWHVNNDVELSVVGTNLFDPEHPEFGAPGTRSEIGRGVYGKVLWHF
jgi:iron complex outermembrane receptor protein